MRRSGDSPHFAPLLTEGIPSPVACGRPALPLTSSASLPVPAPGLGAVDRLHLSQAWACHDSSMRYISVISTPQGVILILRKGLCERV